MGIPTNFFRSLIGVIAITASLSFSIQTAAAQRVSLIRDAEIEQIIRIYATPLFEAAGLNPGDVQIYLVNDRSLNAFVAGGQKLFLNTGLLMKAEHPGQVIGVIAHETGHIEGGHLTRTHDALANSSAASILALVLGGAAAIAGRGDVGAAVIAGGQGAATGTFLAYSRAQESSADSAGLRLLESTGQSALGFLEFLETLEDQELLSAARQDPYMRTHPVSRDRIAQLRDALKRSEYTDKPIDPELTAMHARMHGKLWGFMRPPGETLRKYRDSDQSIEARYARAAAYHRKPDLENALAEVDSLLSESPGDPFFNELKGQILREHGKPDRAIPYYVRAVEALPGEPLLRSALAQVQLDTNDAALLGDAAANLQIALRINPRSPFDWRQLAIAFGRMGDKGRSSLALAEEALLLGKKDDAIYHAGQAEKLLPEDSPAWIQARDIKQIARGGD